MKSTLPNSLEEEAQNRPHLSKGFFSFPAREVTLLVLLPRP